MRRIFSCSSIERLLSVSIIGEWFDGKSHEFSTSVEGVAIPLKMKKSIQSNISLLSDGQYVGFLFEMAVALSRLVTLYTSDPFEERMNRTLVFCMYFLFKLCNC